MTDRKNVNEIVYEISDQGFLDAIEIRAQVALMQEQNSNGVNESLSQNGAGHAGQAIRNAIMARIALLTSRCYDRPREGDLHVARAFELLANPAVREEFETRTSKQKIDDVFVKWHKLKGDHRREKIKLFRDKYTAHLGETDGKPLPLYSELHEFAQETSEMMSDLSFATGARTESVSAWDEQIAKTSHAFWAPWQRK